MTIVVYMHIYLYTTLGFKSHRQLIEYMVGTQCRGLILKRNNDLCNNKIDNNNSFLGIPIRLHSL